MLVSWVAHAPLAWPQSVRLAIVIVDTHLCPTPRFQCSFTFAFASGPCVEGAMLLSELHFWTTLRDEVRIKSSDLGAFRYKRQRDLSQELTAQAKRDYTERRNGLAVLKNSRKAAGRLKDNLKKLEDLLRTHKLVHSEWQDGAQVLLLFDNGIIAHICVDIYTGDILRMVFEKYLVGKLAAELITDGESSLRVCALPCRAVLCVC